MYFNKTHKKLWRVAAREEMRSINCGETEEGSSSSSSSHGGSIRFVNLQPLLQALNSPTGNGKNCCSDELCTLTLMYYSAPCMVED